MLPTVQNEVVSLLASAPLPMEFAESFFWRSLSASLGGLAVCLAMRCVQGSPVGKCVDFHHENPDEDTLLSLCLFGETGLVFASELTDLYRKAVLIAGRPRRLPRHAVNLPL